MALPQPAKNPSHPTTIDPSALTKTAQDYAKITGYRAPTKGTPFQDIKPRCGGKFCAK